MIVPDGRAIPRNGPGVSERLPEFELLRVEVLVQHLASVAGEQRRLGSPRQRWNAPVVAAGFDDEAQHREQAMEQVDCVWILEDLLESRLLTQSTKAHKTYLPGDNYLYKKNHHEANSIEI